MKNAIRTSFLEIPAWIYYTNCLYKNNFSILRQNVIRWLWRKNLFNKFHVEIYSANSHKNISAVFWIFEHFPRKIL